MMPPPAYSESVPGPGMASAPPYAGGGGEVMVVDTEKVDMVAEKQDDKVSGNTSGDSFEAGVTDSLLTPEPEEEEEEEEADHVIEAVKPKFSSPIWLDEIQNNKIFNKQRSENNTEAELQGQADRAGQVGVYSINSGKCLY